MIERSAVQRPVAAPPVRLTLAERRSFVRAILVAAGAVVFVVSWLGISSSPVAVAATPTAAVARSVATPSRRAASLSPAPAPRRSRVTRRSRAS